MQKKQQEAAKGNKKQQKAVIFTLFSDKKFLEVGGQIIEIMTALPRWMFSIFQYFEKHRVPLLSKLFDYRNLMFFYPLLVWVLRQKIRKFGPDEMVVSSFAAVKNVLPKRGVQKWFKSGSKVVQNKKTLKTTLYLHSPMQYIWDYYEDNVRKLSFPIKQFYQLIAPVLRRWDKTPRYYDRVICNSHYTAAGAHRLYGRDHCEVQYPVIDPQYLQVALLHGSLQDDKSDYYVFIGRLVRFAKELDLIIRMFDQT
jgi:glycosyltransferase involved in cell wall biosynthesis